MYPTAPPKLCLWNERIFGSLRSWVKYERNREGVGKCGGGMGKRVGVWGRCRGCRGRCGKVYEVSVEVVGNWGKMCWMWVGVEKCVGGAHTLFYVLHLRHTFPHSPHTHPTPFPHIYLTRLSTLSRTHTSPHSLTLLHIPHTFPSSPPHSS